MLDDRNETRSSHEITDLGIWDRQTNLLAWHAVLGDRAGADDVPAYSAPARAGDLSGLPPTFLAVGELDLFRARTSTTHTGSSPPAPPSSCTSTPAPSTPSTCSRPPAISRVFSEAWLGFLSRRFAVPDLTQPPRRSTDAWRSGPVGRTASSTRRTSTVPGW